MNANEINPTTITVAEYAALPVSERPTVKTAFYISPNGIIDSVSPAHFDDKEVFIYRLRFQDCADTITVVPSVKLEIVEPTPTPGIIATIESSLEVVTDEAEREQLYTDLINAWEDLQCEIEAEAQARTERNTHRETLLTIPDMEVTKRIILAEPESRPLKSRTPRDLIYGVWHSMQATQDLFHITMQFRAYCKAHGMDYDTLRDELVYEASVGNPKGYTRKYQNLTEAETVQFVREIEKLMVDRADER